MQHSPSTSPVNPAFGRLKKVLFYIGEHNTEEVRRNQAAAHCGVSASFFSSVFTQHIGCSSRKYLIQQRIRRASYIHLRPANADSLC